MLDIALSTLFRSRDIESSNCTFFLQDPSEASQPKMRSSITLSSSKQGHKRSMLWNIPNKDYLSFHEIEILCDIKTRDEFWKIDKTMYSLIL